MFVVLEGADGVGKSTLAGEIAREMGGQVEHFHHGPPVKDVLEEYANDYESYYPGCGRNVVVDRLHWGQPIYGPIYRGKDELGEVGFRWVELFHLARGVALFHIDEPLETVLSRIDVRGDDYVKNEHLPEIIEAYRELNDRSPLSLGTYRPSDFPKGALAKQIVKLAKTCEWAAIPLADFRSYIGPYRPAALLLGEKRGGEPPYKGEACFYPMGGRSGQYLMSALPDPFWSTVGLANACEEDVPALLDALGRPPVVALGRAASDVLLDHDIPHAGVPHPQAVRRFAHKRRLEYGHLIERVARTGETEFGWLTK